MRHARFAGLFVGVLATAASTAAMAQEKKSSSTPSEFSVGYTDIGPVIGLGSHGGGGLAFGGRFEKAFKKLPNLGNGVLAFQLGAEYYHYSQNLVAVDYSFSYIPIGATINYHIHVNNGKFDPFVGLGLGYTIVSTSYGGSYDSGIYFIGRGGLRYFVKPKFALYGDVGAGASTLNFGLMFKLGGGR